MVDIKPNINVRPDVKPNISRLRSDMMPNIARVPVVIKPDISRPASNANVRKPIATVDRNRPKKTRKVKKKRKKDPNAPPRPASAFIRFSQANRERIIRENPEATFGNALYVAQIGRLMGEAWKQTSAEEQMRYYVQEANAREIYEQRLGRPTNVNALQNGKTEMCADLCDSAVGASNKARPAPSDAPSVAKNENDIEPALKKIDLDSQIVQQDIHLENHNDIACSATFEPNHDLKPISSELSQNQIATAILANEPTQDADHPKLLDVIDLTNDD